MKIAAAAAMLVVLAVAPSAWAQGQSGNEIARREALRHFRSGQELLIAERYEQAAAEFTAAIEQDPVLTLAHYGLGQSYMALKRYASAIQAFSGCRDAYATLAAQRQNDILGSERRLDEEARELRDSIARVRSGQVKGAGEQMVMQMEKRLEEIETLRRSKGGDRLQTPAEVSLALGSAYYRNNQAADAEREWVAATAANPRLGEAHNNLAVLYLLSGRKKEAEDAVKAAERARFRVNPQLKADIGKMK